MVVVVAEFVGGAFLGAVFGELLKAVEEATMKKNSFKSKLNDIEFILRSIIPIIKEIEAFNKVLDRPKEETDKLKEVIDKGKEIVIKCSKVSWWQFYKKAYYATKLLGLEKSLGVFSKIMQAQQTRDIKETSLEVKDRRMDLKRLSMKESFSGRWYEPVDVKYMGSSVVPGAPPVYTVGLDVPLMELNTELFKDGGEGAGDEVPLSVAMKSVFSGQDMRKTTKHLETKPSTSAPVRQVMPKLDFLPMHSQWEKGNLIGRGTYGRVYVARHRETAELCVIKEVETFDDQHFAECIKQLVQEMKLLRELKHPNIMQYYGSEVVDDQLYIYLEYVQRGSISKYIREHGGAITESVVRKFTRHIVSGLAYLHSTKTIHRDIKGVNLLVDASGVVKLADFGVAKHLAGTRVDLSSKGSQYWMAPELTQAVMREDIKSDIALAVDIWSLGCTIIEMLTGKPPWRELDYAAIVYNVVFKGETPPIPETLSPEGKDFLRCCFQRNPSDRPSASILVEHQFLTGSELLDVC